jgi:predicted AAA+ superfamily ATPase
MYNRLITIRLSESIQAPFVHILFGARQTGKSTLLKKLVPNASIWLDFSDPSLKMEYFTRPELFINQCKAVPRSDTPSFVVVDEVQTVPSIFDSVQSLYDSDKERWRFVLCGSSARKVRSSTVNLLPGRSIMHNLYPLTSIERPFPEADSCKYSVTIPFTRDLTLMSDLENTFPPTGLIERLSYGELPGIAYAPVESRNSLLKTYSLVYIEEEIRREAHVKNLTAFSRFLQLAAAESGNMLNYAKVAKDAAVSIPTIKSYFQLLEDMFICFRITAFSKSARKNLLSTERMCFFDLGVRHSSAGLKACPETVLANPGPVFEQWVGIELWKRLKYNGEGKLHYLRSSSGTEIDYIIECWDKYVPIEVKWTEYPDRKDARHLEWFMKENSKKVEKAYIICRCKMPMEISENIIAVPYHLL